MLDCRSRVLGAVVGDEDRFPRRIRVHAGPAMLVGDLPEVVPAPGPIGEATDAGERVACHSLQSVSPIRIVLADDHRVVRTGLVLLLEAEDGIEVVAETGDVDGALRAVLGHKPDVLILDLNMPGTQTSLEALPLVRERSAQTATVVLTMQEDPEYARRALRTGALGYVLKEAADAELVEAVRRAADGKTYLNPSLGARLAATPEQPTGPPDDLSGRELEVLRLIALGHTNAEIGAQLVLSVRTVETHRAHVQQKLGRSTRAELVRYALDHGLLSED